MVTNIPNFASGSTKQFHRGRGTELANRYNFPLMHIVQNSVNAFMLNYESSQEYKHYSQEKSVAVSA